MDIILKKATIEDIPKLIEVEKRVMGPKTYSGIDNEKEWLDEFGKQNQTIFLILKDNKVVGDVSYEKNADGSVYFSGLVVDPKFQGMSIGRKATEIILEEVKDAKKIYLVTHPENMPAIKLYSSLGFVVKEQKENYYGDGQPRVLMVKENK